MADFPPAVKVQVTLLKHHVSSDGGNDIKKHSITIITAGYDWTKINKPKPLPNQIMSDNNRNRKPSTQILKKKAHAKDKGRDNVTLKSPFEK